jgi:hypothetical protein
MRNQILLADSGKSLKVKSRLKAGLKLDGISG